jgi:hypothetical protein
MRGGGDTGNEQRLMHNLQFVDTLTLLGMIPLFGRHDSHRCGEG